MQIIKSNNITSFDVDNTLVMWTRHPNDPVFDSIKLEYGNEEVFLKPHSNHIRFLKNCSLRGDHIEVWSKNGWEWALQVVEALQIEEYVNVVRAKPSRHVDDKDSIEDIVGARIYMGND